MRRGHGVASHLVSLLAFTAVAVAWALWILGKGGGLPDLDGEPYRVSAVIPSGASFSPGARVTAAGAQVGRIKDVERQGAAARLELEIDDEDVVPLPADSRIQVRQHSPIGETYVAIAPGRSTRTLASGDALPVSQADDFVDVDRLLSVLKGPTRERARMTIRSLGGALEGRGEQANELLGNAADFLNPSGQLVDVLYRDREQASRLIDQLGEVTAAVGQRDAAITTIAQRGLVAMGAIRDRDEALRQTIEELPESLRQIRSTSDTVRSVSAVAQPVVDDATSALRALEPAVDRLSPAANAGRGVMQQLNGAAPALKRTLQEVTALSGPLTAALPKLHKTICESAPALRYFKPYAEEAVHILIGLGSTSNSYDATGHLIRLAPIFSENSVSGMPDNVSASVNELLYGGLLGRAGTAINYDAYPKLGSLGRTAATSNAPIGPEKVPDSGYTYPRIEADC